MLIGYARVSTDGQSLDAQIEALRAAGCERIASEKESGARRDRPALRRLLASLRPGDVLVVTRLDRLARSTMDLLNILHGVGESGAAFRSIADVWADTSTPHGRLMVTLLAGIAEFERALIMARTAEGRRRAKERGVRFGRKTVLNPKQVEEVRVRAGLGESVRELGESYGVGKSTIARVVKGGVS
mgnify:CR=1 FL=1